MVSQCPARYRDFFLPHPHPPFFIIPDFCLIMVCRSIVGGAGNGDGPPSLDWIWVKIGVGFSGGDSPAHCDLQVAQTELGKIRLARAHRPTLGLTGW